MRKRLFAADPLRRIERQHLAQQIERKRVRMRVQRRKRDTGLDGQRTNVVLSTWRADPTEGVFGGRAEVVQDLVKLVDVAEMRV